MFLAFAMPLPTTYLARLTRLSPRSTALRRDSSLWSRKDCLVPFGTNYLRKKAAEYRALAATMTDGAVRLQLLNMAAHYDREAEQNERQHQVRAEKAATSH